MGILTTIAGLFATQKAADTALKLVERFANSDMTASEKAEFILKYQEATRHQSPARRFIAFMVALFWLCIGLTWLFFVILSTWYDVTDQIRMVRMFAAEVVAEPFNLALCFYFGMGAITNFKSKGS